MGYLQAKERVSLRSMRGEGERGNDLPGDKAPWPPPGKGSSRASERDEWLRLMWRSTFGKLDGKWLVFVDEMDTHTSLAPLYAYSPRSKRAFFKVPRNRGRNTTLLTKSVTKA